MLCFALPYFCGTARRLQGTARHFNDIFFASFDCCDPPKTCSLMRQHTPDIIQQRMVVEGIYSSCPADRSRRIPKRHIARFGSMQFEERPPGSFSMAGIARARANATFTITSTRGLIYSQFDAVTVGNGRANKAAADLVARTTYNTHVSGMYACAVWCDTQAPIPELTANNATQACTAHKASFKRAQARN